jgi:hypothetical protein
VDESDTKINTMAAMPFGTAAFQVCGEYDRALKEREIYEALRSQQQ